MPNLRALGVCLVAVGILLAATFVLVEGHVRHANNGLVVAFALTPILTAAFGLVIGTFLRTANSSYRASIGVHRGRLRGRPLNATIRGGEPKSAIEP
jgi:hypothetical protein